MISSKIKIIKTVIIAFIIICSISIIVQSIKIEQSEDIDPLVDLEVTFELLKIRSLEKFDRYLNSIEFIDILGKPDFYVKLWINNESFTSPIFRNMRYIYKPNWNVTVNVPEDEEWVEIKIQLWDWNIGKDKKCDISGFNRLGNDNKDVDLRYNLKYNQWIGDDFLEKLYINADPSGYGRLNGCDDGTIFRHDFDCELWFNIYQNDYDKDGISYWSETEIFQTDPTVDDRGRDDDNDSVPIEWEYKWGQSIVWDYNTFEYKYFQWYDPFNWEDHKNIDSDYDGLSNYEEFITSKWGSDPFRKDLFVELDIMEEGPNGEISEFPQESKELLNTAFNRQNIVLYLDDGCFGGGEPIPFDDSSTMDEIRDIYWNYFLHQDEENWRFGIFHYGLLIYNAEHHHGFGFSGRIKPVIDSFQISALGMETKSNYPFFNRETVYASAYMHELGHTLGIYHGNTQGCDNPKGDILGSEWLKWRPYKSVMNYGYMYRIVDFSDGSRGKNDFDDWNRIDLTYFQMPLW
jgi:hypothetical protein